MATSSSRAPPAAGDRRASGDAGSASASRRGAGPAPRPPAGAASSGGALRTSSAPAARSAAGGAAAARAAATGTSAAAIAARARRTTARGRRSGPLGMAWIAREPGPAAADPTSSEGLHVALAAQGARRVVVLPLRARGGVPHRHPVLDVRERAEEDPEAAVDRAAVEHLDRELEVAGIEEPEGPRVAVRSEEHTSELQSPCNLVCRLLLEKKNNKTSSR